MAFWPEHWERMLHSAFQIGMEISFSEQEILDETFKLLKQSKLDNAYIRWVVSRGAGEIGLDPSLSTKNNFVIFVRPQNNNPKEWYEKGVSLLISGVKRNDIKSLDPNVKSGNYLNNLMAIKEAKEKGFFDAIMLNLDGKITEGTTFNFWTVKDGVYYTPPMKSGILKGITREKIFHLMKENNLKFEEKLLTEQDAFEADEAFITSSTKEIVPVNLINDQKINSPGPFYQKLYKLYVDYRNQRLVTDNLTY